MSKKEQLAKKVKEINKEFSEEQAMQIAKVLMTLSEVYYESESMSNPKKKAA